MGKRSNFLRRKNDDYATPSVAVKPLLPFLGRTHGRFIEPCCGEGHLIDVLVLSGMECIQYSDMELDARRTQYDITDVDYFITNPPWTRELLHPIIDNLRKQLPTWLLFDADWMHTKQARPYLPFCDLIVSVGRVKWIPDSLYVGKDNSCWYKFINQET